MGTGCCGDMPRRRRTPKKRLPTNPSVTKGVRMMYVGAGYRAVTGKASGLRYFLSDHRRQFRVDSADVEQFLRSRYFMLEP